MADLIECGRHNYYGHAQQGRDRESDDEDHDSDDTSSDEEDWELGDLYEVGTEAWEPWGANVGVSIHPAPLGGAEDTVNTHSLYKLVQQAHLDAAHDHYESDDNVKLGGSLLSELDSHIDAGRQQDTTHLVDRCIAYIEMVDDGPHIESAIYDALPKRQQHIGHEELLSLLEKTQWEIEQDIADAFPEHMENHPDFDEFETPPTPEIAGEVYELRHHHAQIVKHLDVMNDHIDAQLAHLGDELYQDVPFSVLPEHIQKALELVGAKGAARAARRRRRRMARKRKRATRRARRKGKRRIRKEKRAMKRRDRGVRRKQRRAKGKVARKARRQRTKKRRAGARQRRKATRKTRKERRGVRKRDSKERRKKRRATRRADRKRRKGKRSERRTTRRDRRLQRRGGGGAPLPQGGEGVDPEPLPYDDDLDDMALLPEPEQEPEQEPEPEEDYVPALPRERQYRKPQRKQERRIRRGENRDDRQYTRDVRQEDRRDYRADKRVIRKEDRGVRREQARERRPVMKELRRGEREALDDFKARQASADTIKNQIITIEEERDALSKRLSTGDVLPSDEIHLRELNEDLKQKKQEAADMEQDDRPIPPVPEEDGYGGPRGRAYYRDYAQNVWGY